MILTIRNLDVGGEWVKAQGLGRFFPWGDSTAIIQEARWVSGQVSTGRENFANTAIRTQDR